MARPNLSYLKNLVLFLCGLPLGLLTGLTATAASVFAVPLVRRLLGLRPERVVGVGLAVTFFAALASILSYAQHEFVLGWSALVLAVFQVAGAAWGERIALRWVGLARLHWLWGTLLSLGGLAMAAQGLGHLGGAAFLAPHSLPHPSPHLGAIWFLLAAAVAAVVGLVSRVIGLGGVLLVPALIYSLGLPPHLAQGTALVVLTLASLPGMLIRARQGDLEPQAGTWLSAGAVLGGLAGALWAVTAFSDRSLLILFGGLLVVLGLQMLWRRDGAQSAG